MSEKTRGFTARSAPNGVVIDQVETLQFHISDLYIFCRQIGFFFWNQINFLLLTELENEKPTIIIHNSLITRTNQS